MYSSWSSAASASARIKWTSQLQPKQALQSSTRLFQSELPCLSASHESLLKQLVSHSSRSVAELVISEVIALSRQLVDRASEMRAGVFNKVSKGCWEVRGKTLGIVGYGHIGSQLSVLAEA